MSRKSSWWLRPQKKGASNRAALEEAKFFRELNSKQIATISMFKAENAKLRELVADLAICACGKYCYGCPHQYDGCDRDQRLRELGIEVDE